MMSLLGLARLKQTKRWMRQFFKPEGLILLYHRVAEVSTDPFHLCVSPNHFAEQLSVIRHYCHAMSLQEMVQATEQGTLPKRAVAITFDDGYADNLYEAKPLLEQHRIPATVFIATGNLSRNREAWWDELEKILLQPGKLPEILCLTLDGKPYQWHLGEAAVYDDESFQVDRTWSWYVAPENDPSPRQQLYRSLYDLLHSLREDERGQTMDKLLEWAGLEVRMRSTHRFLSPEEVFSLGQGDLIEIGAHTVNHPFLSTLPVELQRQEVEQSKTTLETLIIKSVQSFAYPHGNYTPETEKVVQDIGFNCACTTKAFQVCNKVDRFQLPRVVIQNWDKETFRHQLISYFQN